jgi:hypothetical protein
LIVLVGHHQKTFAEAGEANKEPIRISATVNAERLPLPARFPSPNSPRNNQPAHIHHA